MENRIDEFIGSPFVIPEKLKKRVTYDTRKENEEHKLCPYFHTFYFFNHIDTPFPIPFLSVKACLDLLLFFAGDFGYVPSLYYWHRNNTVHPRWPRIIFRLRTLVRDVLEEE